MKKDFYIQLIEHADSFDDPFSKQEFEKELSTKTEWQKKLLNDYFQNACSNKFGNPYKETFFNLIEGDPQFKGLSTDEEGRYYILSSEAKFRYLDFQELQLSREASTAARKHSNIALVISIVALIVASAGAWYERESMIAQKQQVELSQPPTTNYLPPTT